jgi:hypothetical protein
MSLRVVKNAENFLGPFQYNIILKLNSVVLLLGTLCNIHLNGSSVYA